MYNHITNNWGDKPHDIPFDVRQPHSNEFMKTYLKQWLTENPDTDVVRFTTFFYHFTLVFNNLGKEKFVDWFDMVLVFQLLLWMLFKRKRLSLKTRGYC